MHLHRPWSWLLLFALSLGVAPASAGHAQQPDAPPPSASLPDSVAADSAAGESRLARLARLPVTGELILLGASAGHAVAAPLRWDRGDLLALGAAAGGIAAASLLDEAGRDLMDWNQSRTSDRLEELVEPFGRMRGLQLLGGLYAAGLVLDDAKLRGVAAEGLASGLVAAGIFQPALAEITGRPRPRRNRPAHTFDPFSGNISFPSGHTTAAFSLASVIATEYPHAAVRVAAYGLASAVGVARMYRGAHFLSDVVAASLLGTVVGQSVARYGQRHRGRLHVTPAVVDGATALAVGVRF